MLKELFEEEKKYLNDFFKQLDLSQAEKILDLFANCKGVLVFTGVGKSGLVAKKIAVTMTSIGIKAFYISPTDAVHGDLGIVHPDDIFIFVSKSGESDELMQLIPSLKSRDVKRVALVSNAKSRLAKACDEVMILPVTRELCPFDLVPVTSSVVQMIFGNVMAVALMKKKAVTLDQYAANHPSGRIGKRLTLKVKDLMVTQSAIPKCRPHDQLLHTLVELSEKKCGCVLIVDDQDRLLGIFTDGDLRRTLQQEGPKALDYTMEKVMTRSPKWIAADYLAVDAMQKMEEDTKSPITALPVIDKEKVIGLIKMHDIVQVGL